jgi:hypothetical protein
VIVKGEKMTTNISRIDVDRSNDSLSSKFCPLLGGKCHVSCVCFAKAYTTEANGTLIEAHCKSPVISGEIQIYGEITNYNRY